MRQSTNYNHHHPLRPSRFGYVSGKYEYPLGLGKWRRYCRTLVNIVRSCTSSAIIDLVAVHFVHYPYFEED